VVVLTRNRRERVLSALDRLTELPDQPQILVVDNASEDGTARAVAARHPRVRLLEMRANEGASARNAGVRALDTELVALNDDDSWWAPGALATAAGAFAARPSLGLLQARILVGPENRLDPACASMAESPLEAPPGLPGPALLGFVACGAVLRRAAFLDAGGFNRRLVVGGEEKLLALDLAMCGWELAYVDSVCAHHHPDRGERPSRSARMLRNELWTAWLRSRPPAAALTSARVVARALRERQAAVLLEALRGVPWVLAERRPLSASLDRAVRRID
jgi:GT2 family glycosyltransferase